MDSANYISAQADFCVGIESCLAPLAVATETAASQAGVIGAPGVQATQIANMLRSTEC